MAPGGEIGGGEGPCLAHLFDDRPDMDRRDVIEVAVVNFYRQVAQDDLLGPVFHDQGTDWAVHVPLMVDYWSRQLLGQPGYHGQPLAAHARVQATDPLTPGRFERWLELFDATVDDVAAGPMAERAKQLAAGVAGSHRRLLDRT